MKALKPILIGAAIIGLAVATGGISLAPTVSLSGGALATATLTTGLALSTTTLGSIALGIGASLAISGVSSVLSSSPKVPASQSDRLNLVTDPKAFRKSVLGSTAFPLDIRFQEWFGADQEYCALVVAHAGHRCECLDAIWINNELAWTLAGGVQGKFVGYFWMQLFVPEGSPSIQPVYNQSGQKWRGSDHLTGCCYSIVQFRTSGTSKKVSSPFSSGVPSRMTFIGRGAPLYDPRRDVTVTGDATGTMRYDNQATWAFADAAGGIGSNLPLQILRIMQGWRITNPTTGAAKLSTGCGLPRKRIHLESFVTAANLADEMVAIAGGGTEPRYHGGITVSEGEDPSVALDALCAACNGKIVEIGGKIGLVIAHNDLASAATDPGLNDDDVIGSFVWNPDPALDQCSNVISGSFTDPSDASLYQAIPYAEARLDSVDGIDRIFAFDLTAVESASHASRVASQVLERRQWDRTFTALFDIRAWCWTKGDIVPFTFAPLSFVRKPFRIVEQEIGQDGKCEMMLRLEDSAIYAWDGGDGALVTPAAPNVYDSRNSPIIQTLDSLGDLSTLDVVDTAQITPGAVSGGLTVTSFVEYVGDGSEHVVASITLPLTKAARVRVDATGSQGFYGDTGSTSWGFGIYVNGVLRRTIAGDNPNDAPCTFKNLGVLAIGTHVLEMKWTGGSNRVHITDPELSVSVNYDVA